MPKKGRAKNVGEKLQKQYIKKKIKKIWALNSPKQSKGS
jgi:hypothetical protein